MQPKIKFNIDFNLNIVSNGKYFFSSKDAYMCINKLDGSKSVQVFPFCLYGIAVGDSIIRRKRVGMVITSLTCLHLCTCLKPTSMGFPLKYIIIFFVFNDLR